MFGYIIGLILSWLIAGFFIYISFLTIKDNKRREKECIKEIYGEIIDIKEHEYTTNNKANHRYTYSPIIKYIYNNEKYEIVSTFDTRFKNDIKIGEKTKIYLNPNNPKEFRLDKETYSNKNPIFIIGFASVFGIGVTICCLKELIFMFL